MMKMIKWVFWSVIAIGWLVNLGSILTDVKKQEGAADEQFFKWVNSGNNAVKTLGIFIPPIGGVLGIANLAGYSDEELSAVLDGFSSESDDAPENIDQERKAPEPMMKD